MNGRTIRTRAKDTEGSSSASVLLGPRKMGLAAMHSCKVQLQVQRFMRCAAIWYCKRATKPFCLNQLALLSETKHGFYIVISFCSIPRILTRAMCF